MSFFPLKIVYVDTNEVVVVQSPEEVENGKTFRVVKTEYDNSRKIVKDNSPNPIYGY